MQKFKISLSTIEGVKKFVNTVSLQDCDVDLISGRYTVDAKSIMGIFSLDLSKPMEMVIHCDDSPELVEKLEAFIIK